VVKRSLTNEGPYGGEAYKYRHWMIASIEAYTGPLDDLGNLHAETLEKLYIEIVGKNPQLHFKIRRIK